MTLTYHELLFEMQTEWAKLQAIKFMAKTARLNGEDLAELARTMGITVTYIDHGVFDVGEIQ